MHYPYDAFLRGTGLTIKFFRLQWYTTALNRTIVKWASNYPKFFRISFDCGVWVSVIALPIVFVCHIAWTFFVHRDSPDMDVGFEIMLPGANLPLDEIGYYIASLGLSTIVHELGHAYVCVIFVDSIVN